MHILQVLSGELQMARSDSNIEQGDLRLWIYVVYRGWQEVVSV